ncbi:MAG: DUF6110 family protein [Oscillospiraceae bacterium]|nr:DUF6110 family protein [Oscillospiraceae bacterium]
MIGTALISAKALFFIGGVATAVVGKSLLKSETCRKLCVKGVAKGLRIRKCALEAFQNVKEEAQDILVDAKKQAGTEE